MDDTARNNSAVNNRVKPLPGTIAHDFSIDMLPLSGGCPTREFFHKRSALPHLNAFGSKTGFVNSIFLLEGRRVLTERSHFLRKTRINLWNQSIFN